MGYVLSMCLMARKFSKTRLCAVCVVLPIYHLSRGHFKHYTQYVVSQVTHCLIVCFLVVPGILMVLTLLLYLHALHDMHVKKPVISLVCDELVFILILFLLNLSRRDCAFLYVI